MDHQPETINCEVTGKTIPRNDAVVFQGKWVGAEGKAILLDRLRSGADEPKKMFPPTILARFGGLFIDGIVGTVVAVIVVLPIAFQFLIHLGPDEPSGGNSPRAILGLLKLFFQASLGLFLIGYFTFYHSRTGQTVGKKMARTKVVDLEGRPITVRVAFLRALYYYLPSFVTKLGSIILVLTQLSFLADGSKSSSAMMGFAMALFALSGLSAIYGVADFLVALFDRSRQRAIHDRLANTRVIRV